jgi:hypothetical protein
MPSDPRIARALDLLERPIEQYRSAVASTLEEVRGHMIAGRADVQARAGRLQEQLGPFAGGRIDAGRLAVLLGSRDSLDAAALQRLERAADTLRDLVSRGKALFQVAVGPGGDLYAAVSSQLATMGRAFSAARIAAAARAGGAAPGLDEEAALGGFPFSEWNAAERALAPPLVVATNGADLVSGALAPFLDGGQKILLIVDGPCAPAPLVRLITPAVLVIQAHEFVELERIAGSPGPAVGALLPASAVRFVHDPALGPSAWQRLSVQMPADSRTARIGGITAAQQLDELRQLELLATHPPAPPLATATPPTATPADPVDRLAAWLLQQSNMAGAVPSE